MIADLKIEPRPARHAVQFYSFEEELVLAVRDFVDSGLADQGSAVLIATPAHLTAFRDALSAGGIDVAGSIEAGSLVVLDAQETLDRFMVGGAPDPIAFESVVGDLMRGLVNSGRRPVAFGEMVALLWEQGNVTGAIGLEELWNALLERDAFSLFCAYPASVIGDPAGDAFHRICGVHTDLVGHAAGHQVQEVAREFDCSAAAARDARYFAAQTLAQWGHGTLAEDVCIVVAELAANAVLHAGTAFELTMRHGQDVLRIAVKDHSSLQPQIDRSPNMDALNGRGLLLIESLTQAWGVEVLPEGGKWVWAEFLGVPT